MNRVEEKNVGNLLRRIFSPTPEEQEEDRKNYERIFADLAKDKGCNTCEHYKSISHFHSYALKEWCDIGNECDTAFHTVTNCPEWACAMMPWRGEEHG